MNQYLIRAALCLSLGAVTLPAAAYKVGDVDVPDTAKVGGKELSLNGAGERRTMGVVKMYVAGLYLEKSAKSAAEALGAKGAKRITLIMQKSIPSSVLSNLFYDAIAKNVSASELPPLKDRLEKMKAILSDKIPQTNSGESISFDAVPGKGMVISYSAKPSLSEVIPGEDFVRAVYKIWLGEKPAEETLKQNLLKGGV